MEIVAEAAATVEPVGFTCATVVKLICTLPWAVQTNLHFTYLSLFSN